VSRSTVDPVDRIVKTLENATASQLQQAFRRLGWPLRFTLIKEPATPTVEELLTRVERLRAARWDAEDVDYAKTTGQPAPTGNCACPCARTNAEETQP
jgi:hypothetical protein